MIKIFGASFDPLDVPERVDIKLAYINWLAMNPVVDDDFSDPYDFIEKALKNKVPVTDEIKWIGQFPVASWLRPKPSIADLRHVRRDNYTQFLDQDGCREYYKKLLDYLAKEVGVAIPVMIGVDHCLTGAVLQYLRESYGECNVLIFDSHCDLIDLETRKNYFDSSSMGLGNLIGEKDIYECGSFLHNLLNQGIINPEKLWIIGAQDLDQFKQDAEALYSEKILPWIKRGMHVVSKDDCIRNGLPDEIRGPTYVSFDMDLGSLACVFAARFLNYLGLNDKQLRVLVDQLSKKVKSSEIELIGLDIMEMDVHFLGETIEGYQDYSGEIAEEIILKVLYDNFLHKKGGSTQVNSGLDGFAKSRTYPGRSSKRKRDVRPQNCMQLRLSDEKPPVHNVG